MKLIRAEQVSNIGNWECLWQDSSWLSCAVSSRQWFQGLLVFSRVLSESPQARSSS